MDPLSISASAITVAALIVQITTTFTRLRSDYVQLPGRLLALNNEVADLAIVVADVDAVARERDCLSDEDKTALPILLSRAEIKLGELGHIVAHIADKKTNSHILQRATVWRKWQPKLQCLQNDLREIKGSLNLLLGASNTRDILHMRLNLENISRTASNESDKQTEFRQEVTSGIKSYSAAVTGAVENLGAGIEQRLANIEAVLTSQYSMFKLTNKPPSYERVSEGTRPMPVSSKSDIFLTELKSDSQSITVRASKHYGPGCQPACQCRCHRTCKISTKGYLDRLMGQLFLGYTGIPLINATCSFADCRTRQNASISIEYWFPLGFCWSQILHLELAHQRNLGPQWQLKTMRRVPDSALCVKYALEGDIDGLKGLFQNGLASPRDVSSTRGYNLLRWALYGQQYKTCQFLLAAGADPDHKPIAASDASPAEKACDIMLRGNISREVEEIMRLISKGTDFVEHSNFSRIHKIVLGLSLSDLREEILKSPTDVDVLDAHGRTALEWAAARGDSRAIVVLLSFGANPNIMDTRHNTPLTLASNEGHTTAVRLLLEAGASPDPVLPPGVKYGTPLNCAARNAQDPALIKTLLDFDANVEACGIDGMTPLLHVSRSKPPSFAKLLLDHGADLNVKSKDGRTPLTTAIVHNNHGVLRLLLDRWFEYTACPRLQGPHLLELSAKHGDPDTMTILANAKHLQLRRDRSYAQEKEKFKALLDERLDVTKELIATFDELLQAIAMDPAPAETKGWLSHMMQSNTDGLQMRDVEAGLDATGSLESPDEFVDAGESFSLKTDDLSSLLKQHHNAN